MKTKAAVLTAFLIAVLLIAQAQPGEEDFDTLFAQAMEALTAQQYEKAIALFQKASEIQPQEPACYYNIACAYSLQNDVDNALLWLEKSIEMGFDNYDHILKDPDLDHIRDTEKFKSIVEKAFGPKKCPDLTLPDLDGKPVALSQFLGKVVILDFWASWAPQCRREIPHFLALHTKYRDQGLVVIGVSDESPEIIKKFAENRQIDYLLLTQPQDVQLNEPFASVDAVPTTFIIDAQGFIVRKYVGYREQEVFEEVLRDLLPNPVLGGYLAQDPTEPEIVKIAQKTAGMFQRQHPDCRLLTVREAATQVVAGTNYYLVLEFATSGSNSVWQFIVYEGLDGECEITQQKQRN